MQKQSCSIVFFIAGNYARGDNAERDGAFVFLPGCLCVIVLSENSCNLFLVRVVHPFVVLGCVGFLVPYWGFAQINYSSVLSTSPIFCSLEWNNEVIQLLRTTWPHLKIVLLMMHCDSSLLLNISTAHVVKDSFFREKHQQIKQCNYEATKQQPTLLNSSNCWDITGDLFSFSHHSNWSTRKW